MAISILPIRRNLKFNLNPAKALTWHRDGLNVSQFMNTMSLFFPVGERFFIDSVRNYRDQITDPELKKAVTAFIGQEAMHSKEHHAFHISAQQYNLDPESLEKVTGTILKSIETLFPKKWNLLVTVGPEHYTAVLVATMMRSTYKKMRDDTIRNLWLWHSIEETEHKAVAYDLYQHLYGKGLNAYLPRVMVYTFSLAMITLMSTLYHLVLMKRDGQLFNLKSWRRFITFAADHYKEFMPDFLAYYRFNFHPNDTDASALVANAKAVIGLASRSSKGRESSAA